MRIFFADLKAAFNRIDRRKLNELMKGMKIEKKLRLRIIRRIKKREIWLK